MEILIQDLQKKIPIHPRRITRIVETILLKKGIRSCHLSIVFVTPQKMRVLNERYLRHSYTTDVLTFNFLKPKSFSQSSPLKQYLDGEIIIAPSMAKQNASRFQMSIDDEITLYVTHGLLHLMGYDDHRPEEKSQMRREENKLMKLFSCARHESWRASEQ